MLVAAGSALVGGARLALASQLRARDVLGRGAALRRRRSSYYAGEMCRALVDAPRRSARRTIRCACSPARGMRTDVWRRLIDRFGRSACSSSTPRPRRNAVLANASGEKIGARRPPAAGQPRAGARRLRLRRDEDFVRDGGGHLVRARLDEPGMLVARLDARAAAPTSRTSIRRACCATRSSPATPGSSPATCSQVDPSGDYWFVDRHGQMIRTRHGAGRPAAIEDALYDAAGVSLCVAARRRSRGPATRCRRRRRARSRREPRPRRAQSTAVVALPEYARPRSLMHRRQLPMTDGFRPIKRAIGIDATYAWDALAQRYVLNWLRRVHLAKQLVDRVTRDAARNECAEPARADVHLHRQQEQREQPRQQQVVHPRLKLDGVSLMRELRTHR